MRTIAFYSLKGGVGKTAAAVNIAYLASQAGYPTLLWDLDPQGAASWYLGIDSASGLSAKKIVADKAALGRHVVATAHERLSVLPGDRSYRQWDALIHEARSPRKVLETLIEPFSETYSLMILDCPPGIGPLATAILRAASRVIVPVAQNTATARTSPKSATQKA